MPAPAAYYIDNKQLSLDPVESQVPAPGEDQIAVASCGTCACDSGEAVTAQDRSFIGHACDLSNRTAISELIAGPLVFLASSAADYLHGTIVTVDGGWMGP